MTGRRPRDTGRRCRGAQARLPGGLPRGLAGGLLAAVLLAACGGLPAPTAGPVPTPRPTISPALEGTRLALDGALRAAGFGLETREAPGRPAEPAGFGPIARVGLRATLAGDPAGGEITVYEFVDVAAAADAGSRLATYLESGPTRVQYPADTAFVVRQLGATLVFFAWSPVNAPDPQTAALAAAIATVGTEIPVRPV